MSEQDLIARIRELFPRTGDDAAVLGEQVVTCDMLIEDVDFTRVIPPRFIARKAIAVNLSDLAAMGARPRYLLIALGTRDEDDARAMIEALAAAAQQFGVEVVGGDLSRAEKLTISVTAIGETKKPLLRSGAKPGDRLYVSRPIGASAAGLVLIRAWGSIDPPPNLPYAERELMLSTVRRHIDPEPEVDLGLALAGLATACIDVSDGLSTDLHHLCKASKVGAALERERIPVFPDLARSAAAVGVDVRQAVLHGGEEFALLFTSPLRESELSAKVGRPVYNIGRITKELLITLDGEPLAPRGFDHFAVKA